MTAREKRIERLKKQKNLSFSDQLALIYDKRERKEKLSYADYVLMLLAGDEIAFEYKNAIYENVYVKKDLIHFCRTVYCEDTIVEESYEVFSCVKDLLNYAKIDGKTIELAWSEISC